MSAYRIITEPKGLISSYIARKCRAETTVQDLYAAVGLVRDDELMAGAIFYGYVWPSIFMNVAADHMTPGFIAAVTQYVFVQARCKSVLGFIKKGNRASRAFAEQWGAKLRGKLEEGAPDDDIMIYQLMARDAQKWLAPRYMAKLALEVA